ncbi:MAG TPA: pentapeptide repeat-containing protein, partial [Methylococcales bacterium]
VGCKLDLANFRFSKLTNVIFKDCTLEEADFYMAELRDVAFQNCVFEKTEFSGSKLRQVDFRTSDVLGVQGIGSLAGAIIDSSQLITLAPLLASALKIQVKDD